MSKIDGHLYFLYVDPLTSQWRIRESAQNAWTSYQPRRRPKREIFVGLLVSVRAIPYIARVLAEEPSQHLKSNVHQERSALLAPPGTTALPSALQQVCMFPPQ